WTARATIFETSSLIHPFFILKLPIRLGQLLPIQALRQMTFEHHDLRICRTPFMESPGKLTAHASQSQRLERETATLQSCAHRTIVSVMRIDGRSRLDGHRLSIRRECNCG